MRLNQLIFIFDVLLSLLTKLYQFKIIVSFLKTTKIERLNHKKT